MALEGRIKRLEEVVVNRIAAGEVIQRPANALKEMLENSLDAKSTSISIIVKGGGIKLLQIQDNGGGIHRDDFGIVCERFTTSKLKTFEDLSSIATFGFRGEALASISHVAHVTITSKTADSPCAYTCTYKDGKPLQPPKAKAGTTGTQITVEDLFYNVTTRRKALKTAGEEYNKILEVVTRYAIHNAGVAFSCKKFGETTASVQTESGAHVTPKDCIRLLYGSQVARELLPLSAHDDSLHVRVEGLVTNANFNMKKKTFILFINNRLVSCPTIVKAVEAVYAEYLPKNTFAFAYLSLVLPPETVDVNVHPTKKEVHFLNEDAVNKLIQTALTGLLLNANASRTFYTQSLLPGVVPPSAKDAEPERDDDDDTIALAAEPGVQAGRSGVRVSAPAPQTVVRTDSRAQTMDAFLGGGAGSAARQAALNAAATAPKKRKSTSAPEGAPALKRQRRSPEPVSPLTSVERLCTDIKARQHRGLTDAFRGHTFVGVVDAQYSLIQFETKLYLIDVCRMSQHLAYQMALFNFGSHKRVTLSTPAPLHELVLRALEMEESGWKPDQEPKEEIAAFVVGLLKEKSEMLSEYFGIAIDANDGLCAMPQLIPGYLPPLDYLPMFFLRLATEVDWKVESACFHTLAMELANLYAVKRDQVYPPLCTRVANAAPPSETSQHVGEDGAQPASEADVTLGWVIEHVIFPTMRRMLYAPTKTATDGTVVEVASLATLYKIFERC